MTTASGCPIVVSVGREVYVVSSTTRRAALAIGACAVLAACSAQGADKAGGEKAAKPVSLTLANYSSTPAELGAFASEVARRSHGTIRIVVENRWRDGELNIETNLIHDVQAGRVDMGWVGTRAWDDVGITSFDTLHLPFLLDSYRLEETVLESSLPGRMLAPLARLRLVGIGILPGELRRVVGVRKPLLRLADFGGLRFGTTPARAAIATLRLLGARPVPFFKPKSVRRFDGFDFPIVYFEANKYDLQARYVTTNLAFWPRPLVIFMNRRVYERLAPEQRELLRDAARAAIPGAVRYTHGAEQKAMAALCLRGRTRFVRASAAALASLHATVMPVLAEVNGETRAYETAVEQMKRQLAAPPQQALACPSRTSTAGGAIPSGTYESTMTAADGHRAQIPAGDSFYKTLPIRHRLVIRGRSFILYDTFPDGHTEANMEGTYTVYRGKVRFSTTMEKLLPISWSFDGRTLRFFDLPFHGTGYYGAAFPPPWTKTR
jgi:TRAP-type C4-dicarboxylate transport system substrate-binding protein